MERERKFRALVVDDNAEIRKLISWALNRESIACDEAYDGIMASNMATIKRYDVVITDLAMPRMHGHKLIVELQRKEYPPLILVVTGVTDAKIIQDLYQRGVEDVFFKPLTMELFSAKVKALLQRNAERKNANANLMTSDGDGDAGASQKVLRQALENAERLREQVEQNFAGAVRVLSGLLQPSTTAYGSHSGRVEQMAVYLGEQYGLSRHELMELRLAALLHDIGQAGLPDKIRRKPPWELDAEEREAYQRYPTIGAVRLSEAPGLANVASIVAAHAENFDGTGFPAKLRESEIPLAARIVRVADGLDTYLMHTDAAQVTDAGQAHLQSGAGRTYDPALVPNAIAHLRECAAISQQEYTLKTVVAELMAGQVIAEDLYDERGNLLLRKGVKLTEQVVSQLQSLAKFQSAVVIA